MKCRDADWRKTVMVALVYMRCAEMSEDALAGLESGCLRWTAVGI